MKINKIFGMLLLILVLFNISLYAYSEETFEIEIPEDYNEDVNEDSGIKTFNNGIGNFNIIVEENTNKVDLTTFTAKEIKLIEQSIDKSLEDINMPNEIISSEFIKVNEYDCLLIKNKCKKTPEAEVDVYQYKFIFTSKNNVYYITYSTINENTFEEFETIVKSFKIKDEIYESTQMNNNSINSKTIYLFVILLMVVLILGGAIVIVFIKLRK